MNEALIAAIVACLGAALVAAGAVRARRAAREPVPGWELLERISVGMVVLDPNLRPLALNTAARDLLGLPPGAVPGALPDEGVVRVARAAAERDQAEGRAALWFPRRTDVRVRAQRLDDGRVLVELEDVTAQVRAQEIRREFVAHASHELKSPVASLQALAEALRAAVVDDPAAAARFAERMVAQATRLGRLVTDLLDLSRLEEAHRPPAEPVDLDELAESVVSELAGEADAKRILVRTNLGLQVWVRGDATQLGAMIRNLLENAIRYSPAGSPVDLYVRREGDEAVVRVSDEGIGIPPEAQPRVFERFYRVDQARSRDTGGTGLGLAIVKHVAEVHGGRVELESEPGRGSTFTVRLPAAQPPATTRPAAG